MTAVIDSESIILRFNVDPTLIGMAAINATGRETYVKKIVVATMPRATAATGQIHFFKVGRILRAGETAIEAGKRGLRLVDPHTLAAFNATHPEFADTHKNATEWVNSEGKFCQVAFNGFCGRNLHVTRNDNHWDDDWWFAGVPIEPAA